MRHLRVQKFYVNLVYTGQTVAFNVMRTLLIEAFGLLISRYVIGTLFALKEMRNWKQYNIKENLIFPVFLSLRLAHKC